MRKYDAAIKAEAVELLNAGMTYRKVCAKLGWEYWDLYRCVNSEKQNARDAVTAAIRRGKLKRPDKCPICGGIKPEAHHPDYSKPLEVEWMCRTCHRKHHGFAV